MLILLRGEGLVEQNPKFFPGASPVTSGECLQVFPLVSSILLFLAVGKSGCGGSWPDQAKSPVRRVLQRNHKNAMNHSTENSEEPIWSLDVRIWSFSVLGCLAA
jgi:hypothetical protein